MTTRTLTACLVAAHLALWGCSDNTAGNNGNNRGPGPSSTIGYGATCATATECGGETPLCNSSGICVECVDGNDCPGGRTCTNGWCRECGGNGDCASGTCVNGRCQDCTSSSSCPIDHTCIGGQCEPPCTSDLDCGGGDEFCSSTRGVCTECDSNADCATRQPGNPICDTSRGRCVECLSTSNCDAGQVCAGRDCQDCVQNTDCGTDMVCDADLECVPNCVTTTPAVVCDPNVCDPVRLSCVECTESSQCTFSCLNNECTECDVDGDCAPEKCINGRCRACRTNEDCVALGGEDVYCVANSCEQCRSSADCNTGAGEVCVDGECRECTDDSVCTDPQKPACVNFKCEECRNDSHCVGNEAGPACVENECRQCETNAHCDVGTCVDLECVQ